MIPHSSNATRNGVTQPDFEQMRRAMVSNQLRTTAVDDQRVIDAMRTVPRELHVPADKASSAYTDRSVPLGNGRALNPAMATGRLLSEAHPQPGERALVVGGCTGYAAALLAAMGLVVTAVEADGGLLALARAAGDTAGVTFVEGPAEAGAADGAPYDLILIDGAIEQVPQALIDQLAEGGRLATAIIDRGVTRLSIGRRTGNAFGLSAFADAEAVILPGFARPREFVF